ncbi:MAG: DUF4249 domain-containing protein [Tannerellaceae bacterium]|jgi:hypothetical protein|nr:DUF4249 domain-containing protein [Tannerellaceae bacterium]
MKPIHLLYLTALLAFSSCQERIDVSTTDSESRLVIYGYITTDTTAHAIRITRSAGYFAQTRPEGISGATVSIIGGEHTYMLSESTSEPGLYLTDSSVCGTIGETYKLQISVDVDGSGPEDFESSSSLLPAPTIDSIGFAPFTAHDRILQVLVWGRLPHTSHVNHFSSHLYLNGILYNDSLSGFRINDDRFYAVSKEIRGVPLFFLNQERDRSKLHHGDTVTIQMEGITAEYATFLTNAQSELFPANPIFDGPPANVPGNIRSVSGSTVVLGFFSAYSKTSTSVLYAD